MSEEVPAPPTIKYEPVDPGEVPLRFPNEPLHDAWRKGMADFDKSISDLALFHRLLGELRGSDAQDAYRSPDGPYDEPGNAGIYFEDNEKSNRLVSLFRELISRANEVQP